MIAIRLLQLTFTALPCSQWDSPGHIFTLQKVQLSQVGPIQFCLDTANWGVDTSEEWEYGINLFLKNNGTRRAPGGDGMGDIFFNISIQAIGTPAYLPGLLTSNDFENRLQRYVYDGASTKTFNTSGGKAISVGGYLNQPNLVMAIKQLRNGTMIQVYMGFKTSGRNTDSDNAQFDAVLQTLDIDPTATLASVEPSYQH